MPTDLRRCLAGCCHFIDNQPASNADYEKAVHNQVEVLIPCRNIPADHFAKKVQEDAGFYFGTPVQRAFGTPLPVGGAFVYNHKTGAFLRQATTEDIKKWNESWKRVGAETRKQS